MSYRKQGMIGTVMVVLIMGLLVSISSAYMKMIQTESQIQNIVDHSDRAIDAAFSGVNYAMAVAQSRKEMFENDATEAQKRYYFVTPGYAPSDWSQLGAALPTLNAADFPNLVTTDLFHHNSNLSLFDYGETASSTAPYFFRVISYPHTDATGNILPGSYIIKSQGRFRIYNETFSVVEKEYKSQIIAEVEINFSRKIIKLKRWRNMHVEINTAFPIARRY